MMTQTESDFSFADYYNKIGYLFYAVLASEGGVTADQMEQLRKHVQRIWGQAGKQPEGFEGYMLAKVDASFDWLHLNDADWDYCMREFAFFYERNKAHFSDEMKTYITDQIHKLVLLMSGEDNPAEKQIVDILKN